MKKIKTVIVAIVAISTLLSLMYLIKEAKRLERYTIYNMDYGKSFIIYSSQNNQKQDNNINTNTLKCCEKLIRSCGYEVFVIENKKNIDIRSELVKKIKGSNQHIILDICTTNLVVNKNTALIRIGTKGISAQDNYNLAVNIKSSTVNEGIKVNILKDSKNNYNQDLGTNSIRIEISNKCSLEEAEYIISKLINVMVK